MKKRNFLSAMVAGLLISAGAAYAHDDATLDAMTSAHGGQLRMTGIYHYELVLVKDSKTAKDNPVVVYVTDHAGNKISTAGATGSATLLAGKDKATAALLPDGDNRMKGTAKYAATPGMKAVVSITLSGKAPEQARFTPLAGEAVMAEGHGGHMH